MKMKIVDAFGTHVGDADVVWKDAAYPPGGDYQSVQDEVNVIFGEPEFTVLMPTRNSAMPWRLEIIR